MTNKKYLPSVIVLYLNYFLHGIGCSILGQVAIKEALSASWNVEVMAITGLRKTDRTSVRRTALG